MRDQAETGGREKIRIRPPDLWPQFPGLDSILLELVIEGPVSDGAPRNIVASLHLRVVSSPR